MRRRSMDPKKAAVKEVDVPTSYEILSQGSPSSKK